VILALLACAPDRADSAVDSAPCQPAAEACNGVDDDCDGRVDEDTGAVWYLDADGDGHGEDRWTRQCDAAAGLAAVTGDCDDADPAVHPGTEELCGGGDEDCDGSVDERGADGCTQVWDDADGDGLGGGSATCLCEPGAGALVGGDCDDADPDRGLDCAEGPVGAPEVVLLGHDAHDVAGWRLGAGASGLFVAGNGQTTWLLADPTAGDVPAQAAATFSGAAWMAVGDLGADGAEDAVFVRASPDGSEHWITYVYTAPFSGDLPTESAAWSWDSPVAGYLGWYNAWIPGDIDGDDAPDLLIGSPASATADRVWQLTPAGVTERFAGEDLGTRAAGADLDGDGRVDVVLGEGDTAVQVFYGPSDAVRSPGDADATLSMALALLASGGDLTGDGRDDLLVGTAGLVWVLPGPVSSGDPAALAAAAIGGEDAGDLVYPSATAGDLDGDGVFDLVVGDLLRGGTGAAYLFLGPLEGRQDATAADLRVYGEASEDFVGGALALHDGRAWVGARGVDTAAYQAGAVWGIGWE
jgi:hypothetical protein